jgi:beta-alanine degradation protein BauB
MASPRMYSVPEISCEHCVTAITAEVSQVPNVASVDVDIDAKTVTVQGGESSQVIAAIDEAGYDAARIRSAATAEQQLDDGVVRVTKWTFPPGSETGAHVHQYDYVVVPVTDGELTIETDGVTAIAPLAIGVSYQRGKGVAHNVANDGDATVAFVEVELLDR